MLNFLNNSKSRITSSAISGSTRCCDDNSAVNISLLVVKIEKVIINVLMVCACTLETLPGFRFGLFITEMCKCYIVMLCDSHIAVAYI